MIMRGTMTGALMLASLLPAAASSSGWFDTTGGRVRLVTTGMPDAEGRLRGALEVALQRGWKTYWRDPGTAGVPPTIDISASTNVADADLAYPVPQRFEDDAGSWAGYAHPVTFPVLFRLERPDAAIAIDANVFLGICENICIPVNAELTVDPSSDPHDPDDAAVVQAAEAAIPEPAREGFAAEVLPASADGRLTVRVRTPGDAGQAELFIAGGDGFVLGTPERGMGDGEFSVEVLDRPSAQRIEGPGLAYTLATPDGAVQGYLPYP